MIKKICFGFVFMFFVLLNVSDVFAATGYSCYYGPDPNMFGNDYWRVIYRHHWVQFRQFYYSVSRELSSNQAVLSVPGNKIYISYHYDGYYYDDVNGREYAPIVITNTNDPRVSRPCYVCPNQILLKYSDILEHVGSSNAGWSVLFRGRNGIYLELLNQEYYDTSETCPYPYNDYNLSPSFPTEDRGCFSDSIEDILTFCGTYIFTPIRWIVPIALILITSFDLAKAVFVKVEDGMKKAKDNFIKRALIALIIFLAPTIVTVVLNLVASVVGDDQCITDVDSDSVNSG